MLSGFSSSDVIEISVKQCYLEIAIKLPQTVLNKGSKKIFENKIFNNHYSNTDTKSPEQPLVVATIEEINKVARENGNDHVKAVIKVKLPENVEWVPTPYVESGHDYYKFLEMDHGSMMKARIIAMFDLREKKAVEEENFSTLEEEQEVDDDAID